MIEAYVKAPGLFEDHKLVGTVLSLPTVRTERFNAKKNYWEKVRMSLIKKDDIFRIYEPDGTRRSDDQGNNVFIARGDAYTNKDGLWQVDTLY
jgi:hypothetical protein